MLATAGPVPAGARDQVRRSSRDSEVSQVSLLCSWFRELSLNRRSVKTMHAYASTALMLLRFTTSQGPGPQLRYGAGRVAQYAATAAAVGQRDAP